MSDVDYEANENNSECNSISPELKPNCVYLSII